MSSNASSKAARCRELVNDLRVVWDGGIRRACRLLCAPRSIHHYGLHGDDQAELKKRIKEIAQTRVRYGHRRIHLTLRRQDPAAATRISETWVMDFIHDQPVMDSKIRILTIVDTFLRNFPTTDPRFSYKGEDVVQMLERVCRKRGTQSIFECIMASNFSPRNLDLWAFQKGVILDFSRPGKPTGNAFIESFDGKSRQECLCAHWLMSLDYARTTMGESREDHNNVRLQSAIGNKPPVSLINGSQVALPP